MKKLFSTILVFILVLCITGCSADKEHSNNIEDNELICKEDVIEKDSLAFISTSEYDIPDAYKAILEDFIAAYPWKNEQNNIPEVMTETSYMYYMFYDNLSDIGYAFCDVDNNGEVEMLIGEVQDNNRTIFDMYSLVNGKAVHIFDGGERYVYTLRTDRSIICDWFSSAFTTGNDKYIFNEQGDGLVLQQRLVSDEYYAKKTGVISSVGAVDGAENSCFISKSKSESDYKHISYEDYQNELEVINNEETYVYINYTPLSEYELECDALESWKELYLQEIESKLSTYKSFSLANIDSDEIPELYLHAGSTPGDIIYTVKDNKLISVTCRAGVLYYIENESLFCVDGSTNVTSNESPAVNYYKLENGEFVTIDENTFDWNKSKYTDIWDIENEKSKIINW